jgi:tRNA modification GTPase
MFHVEQFHPGDTIAAVSTPAGESGIAVVRISGDRAFAIVESVFRRQGQRADFPLRHAMHGWILDGSEPVDEAVVVFYGKPESYTGEDVAEISCHGSPFIARRIVELFIRKGARSASPGEFTARAFLNGKMDLAQAEAVADMIHSRTEASRTTAVGQLEGGLSRRIRSMRERLMEACSLLEIELDFSEEDLEFVPRGQMSRMMSEMISEMDELIRSHDRGRISREGLRIVLIGRPNVGKSSLLNALVEKERSIVTDVPGTTRDTVEDMLDIRGVLTLITDTAGIRESEDPIEREGVRRAEQASEKADWVLCVIDRSRVPDDEDMRFLHRVRDCGKKVFWLINKTDLHEAWDPEQLKKIKESHPHFSVSALTREGIQDLIRALEDAVSESIASSEAVVLTNVRHRECLEKSRLALMRALESSEKKMSQEYIALDLRDSLDHLSLITGESAGDDILNQIFSKFCIGK